MKNYKYRESRTEGALVVDNRSHSVVQDIEWTL